MLWIVGFFILLVALMIPILAIVLDAPALRNFLEARHKAEPGKLDEKIRAEGRRLRASGRSDLDALADLDGQRSRWLARGRALLDERLGPRPAASGDQETDAATAETADAGRQALSPPGASSAPRSTPHDTVHQSIVE